MSQHRSWFSFPFSGLNRFRITTTATRPNKGGSSGEGTGLPGDLATEFGNQDYLGTFRTPCQLTGKSGVRHTFTFGYGEADAINVVGDFVENATPVDETKVLSLFIKVYDVGAKHAVLCVIPSLTPEAKKLSGLYKITTVESADRKGLVTLASDILRRLSKGV